MKKFGSIICSIWTVLLCSSLLVCVILLTIALFLEVKSMLNLETANNIRNLSNEGQWVAVGASIAAAICAVLTFLYSKFISRFQAENAVFTQMYSQQNIVVNNRDYDNSTLVLSRRRKIKLSGNAYAIFRKFIVLKKYKSDNELRDMSDIWTDFSNRLTCSRSATLSPAFKYLHDEIKWVADKEKKLVDLEKKKSYVSLVQSQLNYDQLLCYMFNLARYNSTRFIDPKKDPYITLLRESKFFENLYDSSDYRNIRRNM